MKLEINNLYDFMDYFKETGSDYDLNKDELKNIFEWLQENQENIHIETKTDLYLLHQGVFNND